MAVVARDVDFSYRVDVSRGVTLAEPIPALRGITLSIPRGGRCAVLGANGAGKSTLLRLLAGRHTPDNGVASILDEPCRSPKLNGRVAYVPAASVPASDSVPVVCAMAWRWTRRWRTDATPSDRERNERRVTHRRAGAAASPR
jgi:ABC-type Mn2+/Zn2+ transport system ATPase subunit